MLHLPRLIILPRLEPRSRPASDSSKRGRHWLRSRRRSRPLLFKHAAGVQAVETRIARSRLAPGVQAGDQGGCVAGFFSARSVPCSVRVARDSREVVLRSVPREPRSPFLHIRFFGPGPVRNVTRACNRLPCTLQALTTPCSPCHAPLPFRHSGSFSTTAGCSDRDPLVACWLPGEENRCMSAHDIASPCPEFQTAGGCGRERCGGLSKEPGRRSEGRQFIQSVSVSVLLPPACTREDVKSTLAAVPSC